MLDIELNICAKTVGRRNAEDPDYAPSIPRQYEPPAHTKVDQIQPCSFNTLSRRKKHLRKSSKFFKHCLIALKKSHNSNYARSISHRHEGADTKIKHSLTERIQCLMAKLVQWLIVNTKSTTKSAIIPKARWSSRRAGGRPASTLKIL